MLTCNHFDNNFQLFALTSPHLILPPGTTRTETPTTTSSAATATKGSGSGGGTRYVIRTSGRCASSTQIRSSSECSAAAKYLNLYDQSVTLDYQYRASHDPNGCYYENGYLKFNNYGGNYGYCTSYDKCLCKYGDETTTTITTTTAFPTTTTTTTTTTSTSFGAFE